jgi:hypothetical protein
MSVLQIPNTDNPSAAFFSALVGPAEHVIATGI